MTRAVFAFGAVLALASFASAAEDIADVKTLEELQQAKPIRLGADWEIRLGLGDGGEAAGTWKLLYGLAKYVGAKEGEKVAFKTRDCGGDVKNLGPVCFKVLPAGDKRMTANLLVEAAEVNVAAPREALYAGVVPAVRAGDWVVQVTDAADALLAEKTFNVAEAPAHRWQTFAYAWAKPKEGELPCVVARGPSPALPRLSGLEPVFDLAAKSIKPTGETPLPGRIPVEEPWLSALCGVKPAGRKEGEPLPPALDVSIEGGAFVIRSKCPVLLWPESRLLARWWVNGEAMPKAALVSRSEKIKPQREVEFGSVVKVGFRLPVILGELKPGDKVAVQILYTPDALELVRAPGAEPADEMLMEMSLALRGDVARVPLLSNRFEFEIFEDLIAPKEEPAAK